MVIGDVIKSAKVALDGQTPDSLLAYSCAVKGDKIFLRASFADKPSEEDLDDFSVVETEIMADFFDNAVETEIEIVTSGCAPKLLSGVCYLKAAK